MKRLIALLLLSLTLTALSHPRGEYLVGNFDGEELEFRMVFQDGKVLIDRLGDDWSSEVVLQETGPGRHRFSLELKDTVEVTMINNGPDEIVLVTPTEKTALKGWRVQEGPVPSWMLGDWTNNEKETVRFTSHRMTVTSNEEVEQVALFQLSSNDGINRMILVSEQRWNDAVLLHFFQLDQNEMVVWDQDDGETKRLYREGWMNR